MRRKLFLWVVTATSIAAIPTQAQERPFGTLRDQAALQQRWLEERLDSVLPGLMREHGISMWVVPMREYNEDPVFRTLVSPTTFAARRRTIYIFYDRGAEEGVERIALGGTSQGGLYEAVRGTQETPDGRRQELWGADQWRLFADVVRQRDPANIAVNISHELNFSDGLSAGEWEQMQEALGSELLGRVVRADLLAVDYMATRVPDMLPVFQRMTELVYEIIGTAFSNEVIMPGVTTTEDVVWWMRQRVNDLGLGSWFQPSVEVQRQGGLPEDQSGPTVILRGDVLHCDFGIIALGLHTDTQHMGYVLRVDDTDVPEGLKQALVNANQLQDITMEEMTVGRTGDEVLAAALGKMNEVGIDGSIYSHPVGDHGHAAGPLIGLWDRQDGVPDRGQVPLRQSVYWSIELQATTEVPEWGGQRVRMALEEDAEQTVEGPMRWIIRRQTDFHIVR
jgi:Xaa-Pro aminopeptidase